MNTNTHTSNNLSAADTANGTITFVVRRKRLMATAATAAVLSLVAWSTGQVASPSQPAGSADAAAHAGAVLVADGIGANGVMKMTVNKSTVVSTKQPYKRVSVGNPEVADVNPVGPS